MYKDIYDDVKSWLIYGETKNGVLLGIILTILGTTLKEKEGILKIVTKNSYLVIVGGIIISGIVILLSFIPFLLSFVPIKGTATNENLIFYKNLSYFNKVSDLEEAYKIKFNNGNNLDELSRNYIKQIYETSKIATNKFRAFSLAMKILLMTVIIGIVLNIK